MDRVLRFGRTERAPHWLCASLFFGMLATGITMGRRGGILHQVLYGTHLAFGGLLVAGVALIVSRGDRRRLGGIVRGVARLDELDRRWLRSAPLHILGLAPEPPPGRFNAGQKLNAKLTSIVILPLRCACRRVRPSHGRRGVAQAVIIVAAALAGGHLYLALLNPRTRGALSGMLTGDVDRRWANEHHPRWKPDDT